MNDDLIEYYNLLGLSPGASFEELKAAHRDLAKVWHPDRFLNDPQLQEKAQEKLKKINEAYAQLRSGKAKRQTQPSVSYAQTASVRMAQKIRWQLILAPLLIFAVAFLLTFRSLLHPGELEDRSEVPIQQVEDQLNPEQQHPDSRTNASANKLTPGRDLIGARSQREEAGGPSTSQPSAETLRPLPTVTVVIDPTTGMIARSGCPMKTSMTYPSGNEPHQYCTSHRAAPTYDAPGPGELRIKSAAKRIVSPGKW